MFHSSITDAAREHVTSLSSSNSCRNSCKGNSSEFLTTKTQNNSAKLTLYGQEYFLVIQYMEIKSVNWLRYFMFNKQINRQNITFSFDMSVVHLLLMLHTYTLYGFVKCKNCLERIWMLMVLASTKWSSNITSNDFASSTWLILEPHSCDCKMNCSIVWLCTARHSLFGNVTATAHCKLIVDVEEKEVCRRELKLNS